MESSPDIVKTIRDPDALVIERDGVIVRLLRDRDRPELTPTAKDRP